VATFALPDGAQLHTAGGARTGLARPSVPLGSMNQGSTDLLGGRVVSYAKLHRTQLWVAVCTNKLTRQVSRLPIKAYKRTDDGRERLRTGRLAEILQNPWPRARGGALKQVMMLPATVHGGGFLYKVRRPKVGGQVQRVVPVPWSSLTAHPGGAAEVEVWETALWQELGVPRYMEAQDVVHIGFRGLEGPLGVSPLEQLGTTVRIEDAAQRHQQALLRNGARPPSAIEASTEFLTAIEPDERQQMMDQLREDVTFIYAGVDQQGKPAVLPPGVTWNAVGHTAVEAELINQRRLAREEVAACYDIPPPLVGILEHATLANVEEYQRMLYTTVLAPWLTLIEDAIGGQLIEAESTIRGDVYVEFDLSEVLKGDLLKRAQALALQIGNGVLTIDEAREFENRPTFGLPETTRPLYPANNLKPVGLPQAGNAPAAVPSDAQVQNAALAVADMNEHELRGLLRVYGPVTDAVLAYATRNGNGHA
jgi:HK97 family phage portal protein